jgi:hypothetical protein
VGGLGWVQDLRVIVVPGEQRISSLESASRGKRFIPVGIEQVIAPGFWLVLFVVVFPYRNRHDLRIFRSQPTPDHCNILVNRVVDPLNFAGPDLLMALV